MDPDGSSSFVLSHVQVELMRLGSSAIIISPTPTELTRSTICSDLDTEQVCTNTAISSDEPGITSSAMSGYSAGQMAGVGVGVGVPLLLALLGAMFVVSKQKRRLRSLESIGNPNSQNNSTESGSLTTSAAYRQTVESNADYRGMSEVNLQAPRLEMPAYNPQELGGEKQEPI